MATIEASIDDELSSALERTEEVVSYTQRNPAGDGDASSTDTQLPPAVEALLRKLRSESTHYGLQSVHRRDLQGQGWGSIFGGDRDPGIDGSLSSEQVRKIRLLVIAAVGRCRTLKFIDLSEPKIWDEDTGYIRLRLVELKALLEPLGYSDVLTELNVNVVTAAGAKLIDRFLQMNSCCEVLNINSWEAGSVKELSVIHAMTEKLRRTRHPALKYWIGFHFLNFESTRVLLKAFPKLQALCWDSGRLVRWYCEDESAAEALGNLYLQHESLNSVGLTGGARALIAFMDYVVARETRPEKFFKRVQLWVTFEAFMERKVISSLLAATTEVLELHCQEHLLWEADNRLPVRSILDASTHEECSKALTLGGFELNDQRVLALATLVSEDGVPERLDLHRCSVHEAKFGVFFRSLRENTTLRTLNLQGTAGLDDEAFRELLSALEVNSLLHDIDITGTDWDRENQTTAGFGAKETEG